MSDKEETKEEMREMQDAEREEFDDEEEETELNPESRANYIKPEPESGADDDVDDDDQSTAAATGTNGGSSRGTGIYDSEEDEDEEEDEEESLRSRKKQRPARNQFIDVEAEVDDEEEDYDDSDDELAREGFIAQEGADDDEGVNARGNRDDRLHRQMDRNQERNAEEDAQRLAAQFKERYGKSKSYRGAAGSESGQIAQRFLLPSINDPSIWGIRCRPGKEKDLVKKLLKRKLTLEGKPNALKILSVFQRDNFSGYIYIEAEKLTAVDVALKGLPDVYPNNGKVLVPVEEFPDLLRAAKSNEVKLVPGGYVRIKRGKYKGDLAIIDAVEENGLEVTLQIVPRVDYKGTDLDDNGKRRRATSNFRPPQRLFSKKEALENDSSNFTIKQSNTYTYRGEDYIAGFLYKLYKVQFLETQKVSPTLEEISKFNTGDSDDLDLSSIAQSLKTTQSIVFNTGDRVQVLTGEQQGLQGDVISAANDSVIVKPIQYKGNNLEFPISNLRKIFTNGDHVSVLSGKLSGHTGIVVSVKDDQVTLISDQSHKDVTVFANHLTKSLESSTLIDGAYDLRDLVRLNPTTVGVVTRADKDVFRVLTQEGIVETLRPSAIESKIKMRKDDAFANDSQGEAIKIGDTVKENSGLKRQGVILHIYRSTLFLHSKTIAENAGMFVTDITSVTTVASKNNFTEDKKSNKLDLSKMNPQYQDGGSMAAPAIPVKPQQTMGRDTTVNQHVTIRLGPYKGYKGIIKETNGELARVELHTKNKLLNVAKKALGFVGRDGTVLSYEEFITTASQRANGPSYTTYGGNTQRGGGANTSYGQGSKTPSWSSSGRGTAYGGNGSSTSWGAGGAATGSGTAYGGGAGTAWGGGNAGSTGTAWGAGGGATAHAGTAWGQQNGSGTSWGSGTANGGGQASSWGQSSGAGGWGTSHNSNNNNYNNNGSGTGYQSSYGGNASGYNPTSQHGGSQWGSQKNTSNGWN